jgi:hypothetical protein
MIKDAKRVRLGPAAIASRSTPPFGAHKEGHALELMRKGLQL